MKLLAKLTLLLLLISQSYAQTESENWEQYLTKKELKMHQCIKKLNKNSKDFFKQANECVKGSEYYQSRTPSSVNYEQNLSIINNYAWFFDSEWSVVTFLKAIKKLNGVRNQIKEGFKSFTHGMGGGIYGSAYAVVGVNWLAEVLLHKGKLGLFCAPGYSLNSAVGAEVGLQLVKTLACKDNQHYTGGFLTASMGINASALALPFGVGGSYSLGIDLKEWVRAIKKAHQDKSIDFGELAREIKVLTPVITKDYFESGAVLPFLYVGLRSTQLVKEAFNNEIYMPDVDLPEKMPLNAKYLKGIMKGKLSLGNVFKKSLNLLNPIFEKYHTPNMKKFFQLLHNNISGCDAIGGSASIAPQASVILNGSLAYYNYHMLFELSEKDIISWAKLSAFSLMNPFFMPTAALTGIAIYSDKVINFGSNVKKYCGQNNIF